MEISPEAPITDRSETSEITLILGGARSGKSAWAQRLAEQSERAVVFLATATADDAEMAERIAAHRAARPSTWRTVESPIALASAVRRHAEPGDLVLIDCLTLWVSNVVIARIGAGSDPGAVPPAVWAGIQDDLVTEIHDLVDIARASRTSLILVSNEVGMGVVPAYPLGRHYRDILGQVNRAAAALADSVILMIAGLPIDLRTLISR